MKTNAFSLLILATFFGSSIYAKDLIILNASYDPTREMYQEYNPAFSHYWQQKTGDKVSVKQSHGGSAKQARSVIDGLGADVVTLALAYDIDIIAKQTGKIPANWQGQLSNNSSPYSSTIVLLVRKDNPKNIRDWADLIRPGIKVITPNPKTSGGARWNYLAAYAWAKKQYGNDEAATDYIAKLYRQVAILDTGARASTTTFAQRGIGDVLITWENEAFLALNEFGRGEFEIVTPSLSIVAEPPVAIVAGNAKKHGNEVVSQAYLEYLYSPVGQQIVARHYFRPSRPETVDPTLLTRFKPMNTVTIDNEFGGWELAQKKHFSEGGLFDQIYTDGRK